MAEDVKAAVPQTAGQETTETQATVNTPSIDDLTARLAMMEKANQELKATADKLLARDREHGAEMKAKKERERKALEEAGQYQELLKLTQAEKESLAAEKAALEQARNQWEMQRKEYALKVELLRPNTINPAVKPEDVAKFIDLSKVELAEDGSIRNWAELKPQLYQGREWLLPTQTQALGTPPPNGVQSTGVTRYLSEAKQVAMKMPGMSVKTAQELLQDPKTYDLWQKAGFFKTETRSESYFGTGNP